MRARGGGSVGGDGRGATDGELGGCEDGSPGQTEREEGVGEGRDGKF